MIRHWISSKITAYSSAYFLHVANLYFIFYFYFEKKKWILGNNPKLGCGSCPPLYNTYNRKSCKKTLDSKLCKEEKEREITDSPYQEMMNPSESIWSEG